MINLRRLIEVPSKDPDDARHRKLLNILLLSVGCVAVIAIFDIKNTSGLCLRGEQLIYGSNLAVFVGILILFVINRYWSGSWQYPFLAIADIVLALGMSQKKLWRDDHCSCLPFLFSWPVYYYDLMPASYMPF
jgi:hypothetical protein